MKNDWNARFGAKRRAIDRALLAECERQIAAEASGKPQDGDSPSQGPQTPPEPQTAASVDRAAIARAFGRPLH